MKPAMLLWNWADAPEEFRQLSGHGGDEDYVMFVPTGVEAPWSVTGGGGSWFGCCDISEHPVVDGIVYIGAHA